MSCYDLLISWSSVTQRRRVRHGLHILKIQLWFCNFIIWNLRLSSSYITILILFHLYVTYLVFVFKIQEKKVLFQRHLLLKPNLLEQIAEDGWKYTETLFRLGVLKPKPKKWQWPISQRRKLKAPIRNRGKNRQEKRGKARVTVRWLNLVPHLIG